MWTRAVLVVEDELLIAMCLEAVLAKNGWRVLGPAATVVEALHLLQVSEPPDAAVLDVSLWGGEMVTPVAEALRARGIPFVLASARDHADLSEPALVGVPNIGKPIRDRHLLSALAEAMVPQRAVTRSASGVLPSVGTMG